jgi:hypothetical protein
MKKIILALLISTSAIAQTKSIKSLCYDANGWSVTYTNEVGVSKNVLIKRDSLKSDTSKSDAIISLFNSELAKIPQAMAAVSYVAYKSDAFTISGSYYFPVLKSYSELTAPRKVIVDNLKARILEVKNVHMTTLYTKFGSEKVTINGVEYPFSDFNDISTQEIEGEQVQVSTPSAAFVAAIQLANLLYNGL